MNRQKLFDSFIEFMGRFAQLKAVAALRWDDSRSSRQLPRCVMALS